MHSLTLTRAFRVFPTGMVGFPKSTELVLPHRGHVPLNLFININSNSCITEFFVFKILFLKARTVVILIYSFKNDFWIKSTKAYPPALKKVLLFEHATYSQLDHRLQNMGHLQLQMWPLLL